MIVWNISNQDSQNIVVDIASGLRAFVGDNYVATNEFIATIDMYKAQVCVLDTQLEQKRVKMEAIHL